MPTTCAQKARHKYDLLVEIAQYLNRVHEQVIKPEYSDWALKHFHRLWLELKVYRLGQGLDPEPQQAVDFYVAESRRPIKHFANNVLTQDPTPSTEYLDKLMRGVRVVLMDEAEELEGLVAEDDLLELLDMIK